MVCQAKGVLFSNGLVGVATVIPTLHAQPLYPYMGKGIIDYLGRYYLKAHITSDGRVVVVLSRDGVVPCRAAMTVFTGHRTHRWYPVLEVCDEYGSEAP